MGSCIGVSSSSRDLSPLEDCAWVFCFLWTAHIPIDWLTDLPSENCSSDLSRELASPLTGLAAITSTCVCNHLSLLMSAQAVNLFQSWTLMWPPSCHFSPWRESPLHLSAEPMLLCSLDREPWKAMDKSLHLNINSFRILFIKPLQRELLGPEPYYEHMKGGLCVS